MDRKFVKSFPLKPGERLHVTVKLASESGRERLNFEFWILSFKV